MKKSRELPVLIANAYSALRPTFGILRAFSDYSFGVWEPKGSGGNHMPPNVSPAETLISLFAEPDFLGGYPSQEP